MKNGFFIHLFMAALLGLGIGECAFAISGQGPVFLWADYSRVDFWILGLCAGLGWALANAAFWRLAFSFDSYSGLKIGSVSLLPALMGFAWPIVIRVKLPSPHDFPLRNLEILLAAQCLSALTIALILGILGIARSRKLHSLNPGPLAFRLGAVAFAVYFLSGLWVGQWNNTGDAPHYILQAHSLAYDHDVDLANNYKNKDWRNLYDRDLEPQVPNQSDGRQIAEHKVGLPLLLVPGYYALGLSGVRLTLALMAALGSALIFLLCLSFNFSRNLSLFGWALFSFSAPWWSHSQIALSELPGGLCFLAVLCAFSGAIPRLWAPLACAAMAWLNVRFFPVALFLALMDAYYRKSALPLLITGLSLAGALAFNLVEFGHLSPAESYTQRNMDMHTIIKPLMIPRYISGLLIDQEFGWLPYCPVFALAFFGLWSQWLHQRARFWMTLLPSLIYIGPVACFPWWISAMAPNRYMVFLTAVFVIWTLEAFKAWGLRLIFAILAAMTFFWGFTLTVLPWFCWGKQNGRNMILEIIGRPLHMNLPPWFPSFWMDDPKSYIWVVVLLMLGGWSAYLLGKPAKS